MRCIRQWQYGGYSSKTLSPEYTSVYIERETGLRSTSLRFKRATRNKKIPFPLYFHHVFLTVCVYYLRRGCQCVCWCAVYSGILGGYFSFHNLHLSHTQSFPSPFLTVSTIAKGRGWTGIREPPAVELYASHIFQSLQLSKTIIHRQINGWFPFAVSEIFGSQCEWYFSSCFSRVSAPKAV